MQNRYTQERKNENTSVSNQPVPDAARTLTGFPPIHTTSPDRGPENKPGSLL